MRTRHLLATGLLAALVVPATPATAAAATCQGRPATLVGAPGTAALVGTDGDDVVVTGGALLTRTGGGNDLVCVTGPPLSQTVSVATDAGADVVDTTAAAGPTYTVLGAGSDRFTGSGQSEDVRGGGYESGPYVDAEADLISTGPGGADHVASGSDPQAPNADVVVVPGRSEVAWRGPMAEGARLDGGVGGSTLNLRLTGRRAGIDTSTGMLSQDGVRTLSWTGFDGFFVSSEPRNATRSFAFTGSGRDESLALALERVERQRISMDGGDDQVSLGNVGTIGSVRTVYDGGSGDDRTYVWGGEHLDLDLRSGRLEARDDGRRARARLTGFEDPVVGARTLVLEGTAKADRLEFAACRASVRAGGGADVVLQVASTAVLAPGLRCNARRFVLFGGGGRDVLRGGTGRDLLVGGAGRDIVSGDAGRDTCSGEKLRSCEVERR